MLSPAEITDDFIELTTDIPRRYLALKGGYGLVRLKSAMEKRIEELEAQVQEKDREIEILVKYKQKGLI